MRPVDPAPRETRNVAIAALLVLCICAIQWYAWVGFISSDDLYYYSAAKGWLAEPWYVPDHFGRIRSAVTLPMAAAIAAMGDREVVVVLPSAVYLIGAALITYLSLTKWVGAHRAAAFTLIFCTLPVVAVNSTIPSADMAELFWVVAAFWAFFGVEPAHPRRRRFAFIAGACLVLAFSGRETMAAVLVYMGILFVTGSRFERRDFIIAALGFVVVISLEAAYYFIAAGEPLLRLRLVLEASAGPGDRAPAQPFTWDGSGTLRVHWLVDPIVMLFTKHHFGIFYFVLAALTFLYLRRRAPAAPEDRATTARHRLAMDSALLGLVWIVFAHFALSRMQVLGRYYIAPTYFLGLASLLLLDRLRLSRAAIRRAFALTVAANLVGILLENKNPRAAERAVVRAAQTHAGPIVTDPYTFFYLEPYRDWAGVAEDAIVGRKPRPGELYVYSAKNLSGPNRLISREALGEYLPKPGWTLVHDYSAPPLLRGGLADWVREQAWLPRYVVSRLVDVRGGVVLYRTGTAQE